jgi:hypothetical protein
MRCVTLCQFAKRAQITFGAVAKRNLLPLLFTLHAKRQIAFNARSCFAIPLGELKVIFKLLSSSGLSQPYHFQADLIWCDGTINKFDDFSRKHKLDTTQTTPFLNVSIFVV